MSGPLITSIHFNCFYCPPYYWAYSTHVCWVTYPLLFSFKTSSCSFFFSLCKLLNRQQSRWPELKPNTEAVCCRGTESAVRTTPHNSVFMKTDNVIYTSSGDWEPCEINKPLIPCECVHLCVWVDACGGRKRVLEPPWSWNCKWLWVRLKSTGTRKCWAITPASESVLAWMDNGELTNAFKRNASKQTSKSNGEWPDGISEKH